MKKDIILCVIVLVLSMFNIFNHQMNLITPSVGLSVIGILGVISYFLKLSYFKYLFLIWIIAQFPIIEFSEIISGVKTITYSFDLNQILNVKLGFRIGSENSIYLGLNIFPFVYIGLYKFLIANSLIGEIVTITSIREISPLNEFSPLQIEIIDTLNNREFVGKLNTPITIEENTFNELVFKTSDKSFFKLNKPRQICDIKLKNESNKIETNGFIK